MLDDICRGEVILDQLGNHALAGNQVGHGHVRHLDDPLGDGVGEGRDAVDHDKGIADEGGFDGGGAAGDDGGAGVEERGAGIVDEADGKPGGRVRLDQAQDSCRAAPASSVGASGMRNS